MKEIKIKNVSNWKVSCVIMFIIQENVIRLIINGEEKEKFN